MSQRLVQDKRDGVGGNTHDLGGRDLSDSLGRGVEDVADNVEQSDDNVGLSSSEVVGELGHERLAHCDDDRSGRGYGSSERVLDDERSGDLQVLPGGDSAERKRRTVRNMKVLVRIDEKKEAEVEARKGTYPSSE